MYYNIILQYSGEANNMEIVLQYSGEANNMEIVLQSRNKISVFTDISVLGFYGNIGNIEKYRWIF